MLKQEIRQIFFENKKRYGSPRIHKVLMNKGYNIGRKRVERLMKSEGLRAEGKKPYKVTTDSKHDYPVAPNLLGRYFEASKSNQVWTGDITYIRTLQGWLYLAVVIDLYSRKIVGWSMERRISSKLVVDALNMAIGSRKPAENLIFHSDRGIQYASHFFQKIIQIKGFIQSMSRKGDCWDNAPTESFFATLKKELIRNTLYDTREKAKNEIFRFIEGYYNNFRLHSFLNYTSPIDFERRCA